MLDWSAILHDFITIWVVVDPIGTLPVFLAVTFGMDAHKRRRVAFSAVLIAFLVLMSFILIGQLVLDALGIALPSFQIAGGIVLFLFALRMIFGPGKPEEDLQSSNHAQTAVFPVAIPSIASPGAMLAVVILTDNNRFSVAEQAVTAGLMALVLLATLVILLAANPLHRLIGDAGASVVSRVMGMVLAAVAVDAVLAGFVSIGVVPAF